MSESKQNKSRQNGTSAAAYYVYCIVEKGTAQELVVTPMPSAIEDGTSIELVTTNSLAAVASRVPLSDYGDDGLAERLNDAAWMAVRAMRHEQVVEHFARDSSVVPLRFGTIYLDRTGVENMLRERETELSEIINRLRARQEWGINVYCDRDALLDKIAEVSPKLREMSRSASQASPGQSYLLQKKIDALRVDEVKSEIQRCINEIEEKLIFVSDGVTKLRVLKVETPEYGELKAKFAFLVPLETFERFRDAAEELAQSLQGKGIRIELTGPWPAYNFASAYK